MTSQKTSGNGFIGMILSQIRVGFSTVALPFFRPTDMGSFGRAVCTFLLIVCYWYSWRLNRDIPATLLTVLQAMLVYLFGTKIYDGVADYKKTKLNLSANASVTVGTVPDASTPQATSGNTTDEASKDS
jgi:hypothetical protein